MALIKTIAKMCMCDFFFKYLKKYLLVVLKTQMSYTSTLNCQEPTQYSFLLKSDHQCYTFLCKITFVMLTLPTRTDTLIVQITVVVS